MIERIVGSIPGATELATWFGGWPSFHDAEILDLKLARNGSSVIRIHTWRTTTQTDPQGHFVSDHHVVVSFLLEGIIDLDLHGFSTQNVISGLDLQEAPGGCRVCLSPCFGLAGEVQAQRIVVTFEPGGP
jgi:hypothetical protein